MTPFKIAKTFAEDESGAVSLDWIVLTAAVAGLAIAALAAVRTNTGTLSTAIDNHMSNQTVSTTF
jgi:Flp pilus assembly pilin Flp